MSADVLFALALVFQVILVSIHYPKRIMSSAVLSKAYKSVESVPDVSRGTGRSARSYVLSNSVIVAAGLIFAALFLPTDWFDSVTTILAALGMLFFFLQLSPLATPLARSVLQGGGRAVTDSGKRDLAANELVRLSEVVPPVPVGMAIVLFVSYLLVTIADWKWEWNTQVLKVSIFVLSNVILAAMIAWQLRGYSRSSNETSAERTREVRKVVATLTTISIGISILLFRQAIPRRPRDTAVPASLDEYLHASTRGPVIRAPFVRSLMLS